jgi:coniferyl-aldehyde dehydrogenase
VSGAPQTAYEALRREQTREGAFTIEQRRNLLAALKKGLIEGREALVAALDADFKGRNAIETLTGEVLTVARALTLNRRKLRRWARPKRMSVSLPFWPARARIVPRPKGVVGILAPWNYPIQLSLWPLADALAAGNRVAVKLPEATPRTSALIASLLDASLGGKVVQTVEGGPEVAAAFTRLPWDHLFYTGSTAIGREVLRTAAENLTPTTLELGGKCPAVVTADADIDRAADAIMKGKILNAGQTCLAPDTVLLVGIENHAFVEACRRSLERIAPVENATNHIRRRSAPAGGIPIGPLTLLPDLPPDSPFLQEEIFGPELPLVTLKDLREALAWIAERPTPLAIYLFTRDTNTWQRFQAESRSGALVRDATVLQAAVETLPFGGIGASGHGRYHGQAGFLTFSDLRTEVVFPKRFLGKLMERPYSPRKLLLLDRLVKRA